MNHNLKEVLFKWDMILALSVWKVNVMDETIIQQTEKVKFSRGASGKFGYEITLLGKPEDNIERIKELKRGFQ